MAISPLGTLPAHMAVSITRMAILNSYKQILYLFIYVHNELKDVLIMVSDRIMYIRSLLITLLALNSNAIIFKKYITRQI